MDAGRGDVRNFILGPNLVSQLVLVVVAVIALQIVMSLLELVYTTYSRMDRQAETLFDSATATAVDIPQGPNTGFPIMYNSRDEQQGSAFSYSSYIFIHPDTFEKASSNMNANVPGSARLKHIFHKGSETAFPNLAPAVFVEGNTNTLRIYMNTIDAWNNYVTVPNIPVGKWFHLVVVLKGKNLDVYVNGNVSVRMKMTTAPKLNSGSLYIMKNIHFPDNTSYDKHLFANYSIDGAMKGMVSRMKYFAYALNYSHIDSLMREGPNTSSILQPSMNRADPNSQVPPYMWDDWWVNKY